MYNMITLAEDNKVEVVLDLTDAEFLVLFKMAHERDMTFNNFVEHVLQDYLEQLENDNIFNKLDGTGVDAMVPRPWPYPEAN